MLDSLPWLLGSVALAGSLGAAGLALYLFRFRPGAGLQGDEAPREPLTEPVAEAPAANPDANPVAEPEPARGSETGAGPTRVKAGNAYCLFVIFAEPDAQTRRALVDWLERVEARYDSVFEVYNVAGSQPANPVKVANAFPPGTLPDLLAGQGDGPLRGLSLLVKPPLRPRRNQQMHVFVALARELEALGGEVLDAERQPATRATYALILGEGEPGAR